MKVTRDIIRPTAALIIICVIVSGIVSIVYNVTKVEEIPGMSEKAIEVAAGVMGTDSLSQVLNDNFPEGVTGAAVTPEGEYVLSTSAKGYNSDVYIEIVVGFNSDDTIKGIAFVNSAETPGIGDKVTGNDDFTSQFIGLSGEIKLDTQVDAISGATMSSRGTTDAVNIAISNLELAKAGTVAEEGK